MSMMKDQSAANHAYETIKHKIVSLEFVPNQAIGETHLAELLGVSRTPVREALVRLASETLVDFRSRAGTIVSPIRLKAVRSAQFVREKLEVAIIRKAAMQHSKRFTFSFRQAIEEQHFAIEDEDPTLFFASDERMHQSFSKIAGYPMVWPVILDAKKHMDRVRWLSLENINLNTLLEDHIQLFDAIEKRDSDRAHSAMEDHLRRVMVQLDDLMKLHPNYFEVERHQENEIQE